MLEARLEPMIRGYLALVLLCLSFLVFDLVQRFLLAPWVRLVPNHRIAVLGRWQRFLAHWVLGAVSVVGGARLPTLPRIPGRPGTLILMNHQSLLDIPLVVGSHAYAYPRIVTRKRYLRWIPLISHMVRLYQYPVVDPRANPKESKAQLASIRNAARDADVPLALFPEGTRTRNGDIGPFRPTGLRMILKQRPWTVYVLVADGFWQRARFKDFLSGMHDIEGSIRMAGPFDWPDPRGDAGAFVEEMQTVMATELSAMRQGAA